MTFRQIALFAVVATLACFFTLLIVTGAKAQTPVKCYSAHVERKNSFISILRWKIELDKQWCARGKRIISQRTLYFCRTGVNWRNTGAKEGTRFEAPWVGHTSVTCAYRLKYPLFEENVERTLGLVFSWNGKYVKYDY